MKSGILGAAQEVKKRASLSSDRSGDSDAAVNSRRSVYSRRGSSSPEIAHGAELETIMKQKLAAENADTFIAQKYPWMVDMVLSPKFDSVIGVFILCNCFTIGLEVHQCPPPNSPRFVVMNCPRTAVDVCEHIFTLIFVLEFFARIAVLGPRYYSTFANACDAVLVWITGVLLTWILAPAGVANNNLRLFTIFRAFRLLRVARIVRCNPEFKEMWLLLKGLSDSMRTLFWTVIVLLFVEYIFGIFAVIVIGDSEKMALDENAAEIHEYFFGLDMTLFTLLQVVTGDGWASAIARPVMKVLPDMWIYFTFYVAVCMLVLLNLITAVIVDNAMAISRQDEEQKLRDIEDERAAEFTKLEKLFRNMDADGSGEIDEEEFRSAYETNVEISDKFTLLGFEPDEIESLFHDLDTGDGMLSLDEFIGGLRGMSGQAQGKDLVKVSKSVERLHHKLGLIMDDLGGGGGDTDYQEKQANNGAEVPSLADHMGPTSPTSPQQHHRSRFGAMPADALHEVVREALDEVLVDHLEVVDARAIAICSEAFAKGLGLQSAATESKDVNSTGLRLPGIPKNDSDMANDADLREMAPMPEDVALPRFLTKSQARSLRNHSRALSQSSAATLRTVDLSKYVGDFESRISQLCREAVRAEIGGARQMPRAPMYEHNGPVTPMYEHNGPATAGSHVPGTPLAAKQVVGAGAQPPGNQKVMQTSGSNGWARQGAGESLGASWGSGFGANGNRNRKKAPHLWQQEAWGDEPRVGVV